ncbi:hypothetical protein [Bradyrhizobium brasilense]|uniref:Uncharacterized protein n=1 Tax=Bradyrhizobium brasilense TaxID=1419277 RepID=A0ABY8JBU3_9BRAD|nr:hypothetical protein [Bradyrhizobium brasilense]WFU62867.1 hypothetical protein QA636_36470 [Bradyrhizobium brasilense]
MASRSLAHRALHACAAELGMHQVLGEKHVSDPLLLGQGELPDGDGRGTPKFVLAGGERIYTPLIKKRRCHYSSAS